MLEVFRRSEAPYTVALLSAVPVPDLKLRARGHRAGRRGTEPGHPAGGWPFHPRCAYATDICRRFEPAVQQNGPARVQCPTSTGSSGGHQLKRLSG
ncbi:hypothetical protein GE300_06845 [Rhodobacteraceae bacterium 2CG4]|uniref:Oligopeptide/dipeptide ABC transporter C-terminal domain-containing protein n=2 Tax=Halovulum marinum TaxID=2662447 RepID=A0A6L5YYG8_9RHOB|nr:hypothetical protein [Halovulum marinum]